MVDPAARTQPIQTQPMDPAARSAARGCSRLSVGLLVLLSLSLSAVAVFAAWMAIEVLLRPYEGRIYPNVTVLATDLGGLTPDEATAVLAGAAGSPPGGLLTLRDGERTWAVPWQELGLHLDAHATARAAYAVGRTDQSLATLGRILVGRLEITPIFAIDPAVARAALERMAPEIAVPPIEATLVLQGEQLVPVPGQPGRALDVESTLAALTLAVSNPHAGNEAALAFTTVPPHVVDATPALAQAEALLSRQVHLAAYDVLTDETLSWTLGRDVLVHWLRVELAEDNSGLVVRADAGAARDTLAGLAAGLGDGRGLRLDEAAAQVTSAFDAGGGTAFLYLTHPQRTYAVQHGDRMTTIAARYGMPPGILIEANPGIDADHLSVGQELTIPSQDVLTPYLPTPGQRIVISIAEQRMRVYENGALLYDWPISTGMASSPTYTGVFQILSKEENAYASQWDLWMPNFMAIYRAGADVYNGIHALPILSSGRRLWEGLLGSPASYGCIILGIQEAEILYNWADVGVIVVIE
jgi:lipoprotein-anchoring transpeptidase ErfK/SrfK